MTKSAPNKIERLLEWWGDLPFWKRAPIGITLGLLFVFEALAAFLAVFFLVVVLPIKTLGPWSVAVWFAVAIWLFFERARRSRT